MFKYKYSKLYWFFKELSWFKVYFSPFKPIIPRFYLGKVAIGTPIFYPRKWVKATPERAHKAVLDYIAREESYNKMNPDYARKIRPYDEVFKEKMRYDYAIPLKIGFSSCGLGWKTKWSNTDFRHEWNPVWSFVAFGYQIALTFRPENDCHYWEAYLYYTYATDKTKTVKERIEQARKEFTQVWTLHSKDGEEKIDYWDVVLKDKSVTK